MKRKSLSWIIFVVSVAVVIVSAIYVIYFGAAATQEDISLTTQSEAGVSRVIVVRNDEPISPIAKPTTLDRRAVELGVAIFHDPRLSHDNTISCASCHDLVAGGVDRLPHSIGVGGKEGDINAPTVYNSSLNFVQFWDGRAKDLAEQAVGPIHNPIEMASNWAEVLPKLNADSDLVAQFKSVFGAPPNEENIIEAIVAFERSLVTPSRVDRWLLGEDDAITAEELEGYRIFIRHGCIACHQGEGIGGNLYQRFGIMHDYFDDKRTIINSDFGRYNVTKRDDDRYVFKVPTLRNIKLTPPYFHDASAATLEEAVARMGLFQLGVEIPAADIEKIVLFLQALTGEELEQ
ncbi:hypothetical protein AGMMS50229_04220 [Campylobacterota bacterium]|nr:hypothetical protein AGMMS50229_04220 [Campylobacterota bacterium]